MRRKLVLLMVLTIVLVGILPVAGEVHEGEHTAEVENTPILALVSTAVEFTSDFDGGNGVNFVEVSPDHWTFQLVPDDPVEKEWFYVKITNDATPRTIELKITNLYATDYCAPVYSSDQVNWSYFPDEDITHGAPHWETSWLAMNIHLDASETKYVAYCIPLHYWELVEYINSLSHPDLTKINIGYSADGRELTLLKIHQGDETGKPKIFFIGDIHAMYESYSARNGMGMVNWLLSDDPYAGQAREDIVWYILLSINPDGLYYGHSRYGYGASYVNLCDHYGDHDDYAELKAVWDFIESIGGVTVVMNMHSWQDPGNHFDWSNNAWCADEEEANRNALKDAWIARLGPSSTGSYNGGAPNGAIYAAGLSKYGISWEQEQRVEENSGNPLYIPYIEWEGEQMAKAISDAYVRYVYPPSALFTYSPSIPLLNSTVMFNASASLLGWNGSHNMPIVSYEWDFGNGNITTATDPIITHVYTVPNTYEVKLTVTDKNGLSHSTTKSITIRVTRSILMQRIAEIDLRWFYATEEERSALFRELVEIDLEWSYSPP